MNDELSPDRDATPSASSHRALPTAELAAEIGPAAVPQLSSETVQRGAPDGHRPAGRSIAVLVAGSMLSAILASAGTAAVVLTLDARGAPTDTAAAAASPVVDGAGTTTLTLESSDAVVAVAAAASPAVVTITTQTSAGGFGPFPVGGTGVGSGFVVDAGGLILTNWHVVEGADEIVVTFDDGRELPGTVVAADETHDLAVVKVEAADLPTIDLGTSADLQVGQLVVAIGSPLGTYTETVTSGILSGTDRTITVASSTQRRGQTLSDLLQTDAAINEGNSGGPLLDATGQAIGINVAVDSTAQGIGFAVPIDAAASVIAEARSAEGLAS